MTFIVKKLDSQSLKISETPSRCMALKLYCLLIQQRLENPIRETMRCITEVHHIIPRCICNWKILTESKHNLIRLYPHEHFLAHYYLTIIFPHNIGAHRAFYLMSNTRGIKRYQHLEYFAKAYEIAKAKVRKGRKNKSYIDLYGEKEAEKIKIEQKMKKLNKMTRILVDK